ncbi:MAG: helix-turn-helix domain-containing protein [Oscillospiraceae bacterium]
MIETATRQDYSLSEFTRDESFPFFIQYGGHDSGLFVHGHADFSELVIVLSGTARHVVGNERFNVGRGDVFCIGSGIKHGYEDVKKFRICNIMFRPEALLAVDSDVRTLAGFHALFVVEPKRVDCFRSSIRLGGDAFGALGAIIAKTIEEYSADRPARKTLLQAYFNEIIVMLSRLYTAPAELCREDGVAAAAALIESRFSERGCMAEVLRSLHYSERHFVRLFTAAYGTTPARYLAEIRLKRACALLRATSLPIAEIAQRCGYSDANYFSRVFRREMAISPGEYRR